jgi:c-di-GMP-related signal transduction protein
MSEKAPLAAAISPANASISGSTRFVGRQPILDVWQQVFGYELLFRSSLDNRFDGDSDSATRQMIDNVVLFGLDRVAPGSRAFVNCTREALTDGLVTLLPPDMTVLEVLETVAVDDEVVAACVDLKKMGYQIALDDYVAGLASDRLLELADYIKVDFLASDADQFRQIQSYVRGTNISLVAEKLETVADFQRAVAEGFRYFQGYFFSRPSIIHSREIPPNQMLYIRLLSAISRSPFDRAEIERLVTSEASFCYRVLRLVNSASLGVRSEITSVSHALSILGEEHFRRLVTVASAAGLRTTFDVLPELILLALQRARFCEVLAAPAKQLPGEQFLIGLISTIDAILQTSMEQVLKLLPLRHEANAVLLGEESPAATPFRLLRHYEQRQWERCAEICEVLQISETELTNMYVSSLAWAMKEVRVAGL